MARRGRAPPPAVVEPARTEAVPAETVPAETVPAETVVVEEIGYMALRRLVVQHGVPEKEAKDTPFKGALVVLARKHNVNLKFVL